MAIDEAAFVRVLQRLDEIDHKLSGHETQHGYLGHEFNPDGPRSLANELVDVADTRALRVHDETTQTLTTGTWTTILCDTIDYQFEMYGSYDTSTGLFTVRRGGIYLVTGHCSFALGSAAGSRFVRIIHTGVGKASAGGYSVPNTLVVRIGTTYVADLDLGDTIGVQGFQNSGGNLDTNAADDTYPTLTVTLIGHGRSGT